MTDPLASLAWLIASIPALVVLALLLYLFRNLVKYGRKNRRLKYSDFRRDESWMGRYLRDYKPRTTIHNLVNRFYDAPQILITRRGFTQERSWADVSFYQGNINWQTMRSKADKVIIRAGQNLWVDTKFRQNWAGAVDMHRSIYFFYDGRVSPSAQLQTLKNAFNGDIPLQIWVDWERSFSGKYEGLKNVVAFMQAIEMEWGVDVGLYTGYYWMRENSNPIYNAAQYNYLKNKKLWLAWYGEDPKIPAPWTQVYYHQWGTPEWGLEWGVETKEIDMNTDLMGDPDPTPVPPNEETMDTWIATWDAGLNKRPASNVNNTPVGVIPDGTQFTVTGYFIPLGKTQEQEYWGLLADGYWVALTYNSQPRAERVTPPAPADEIPVHLHIVVETTRDGRQYSGVVDVDVVLEAVG